jgi:AcrR family transcriptional regulator
MKASPSDPRTLRTRAALLGAVMSLVAEAGIGSLTIAAITRNAGLHRSTFYLHYDGLVDLYRDCMQTLFDELRQEVWALRLPADQDGADAWVPHVACMFRHLAEHEAFYGRILGRPGAPVFRGLFQEALYELMVEPIALEDPGATGSPRLAMTLRFFIGGFTEVASWWLQGRRPISIEDAAGQVVRDMLPDYLRLLGDPWRVPPGR